MSKKILFLLILFIIVAGIFVFFKKGLKERELKVSIIGDGIDLVRVGMFGQKADFGFVKVPFLKESDTLKFLNVAVDLNNDQNFATYKVNDQTQPEWLVQNMPVKFIDGENSFSFFFPDKTVDDAIPAGGLILRAVLSRDLINVSDWDGSVPQETDSKDIRIKIIIFEDVGDLLSPAPGKIGNFGFLYSDGYINFIEPAFAATDTVDVFHPNVPDINQKKNECAPTSAANSLLWLAKKFKFEDKLPSQGELIEELKNDMNWQADGIDSEDFLKGKEKITERRKFPLINHEVGKSDGSTTFDKMAEELKKEQDVEMMILFKDANGKTIGGHCVTVVGVMRLPSGTEIIHVHDPGTPGPASMEAYRLDKTDMGVRIVNYPYGRAYISFAVSESYVKPVPPAPAFPIPPAPETPVTPEPEEETQTPTPTPICQCSDGTLCNVCKAGSPSQYCDGTAKILLNRCSQCGCPAGQECQTTGSCIPPPSKKLCKPTSLYPGYYTDGSYYYRDDNCNELTPCLPYASSDKYWDGDNLFWDSYCLQKVFSGCNKSSLPQGFFYNDSGYFLDSFCVQPASTIKVEGEPTIYPGLIYAIKFNFAWGDRYTLRKIVIKDLHSNIDSMILAQRESRSLQFSFPGPLIKDATGSFSWEGLVTMHSSSPAENFTVYIEIPMEGKTENLDISLSVDLGEWVITHTVTGEMVEIGGVYKTYFYYQP